MKTYLTTDQPNKRSTTTTTNHRRCMNQMSSTKLRLMCSNGGHIIPRPHDKTLCYIGGETRIVVVDRHTTLLNLTHRLSKTLLRSPSPFTIKYQLPSEDLDSLFSLTTDEDLQHMIEEYDRLNSSSRLRLFIFPTDPESLLLIGSGLESLLKSEDGFLNVLNGANLLNLGVNDPSSFSCLLNLDDEVDAPEKKDVSDGKTNGSGQDVHSVPDSLMMETTSSFGSESTSPSLVNVPPIRVNADDHQKVIGGVEEQFSQMSVEQRDIKHQNDEGLVASPAPVVVSGSPVSSKQAIQEQSEQGLQMAYLKCHHQQYLSSDLTGNYDQVADPNDTIGIQLQPLTQNPAYMLSMPTTRIDSPRNQLHNQQPLLIPPPQYIHHHHHPSGAVPMASYYHHQPHQLPMDQQNFVYYIPARQLPQGYNFPLQQPHSSYDAPPVVATIPPGNQTILKTDSSTGVYRTTSSVASQPVRTSYKFGYSETHQPSQLLYYATQAMPSLSAAHYENMASTSPFEASLQEQARTTLP